MTRVFDDPARFSEDVLEGFLDVYGDRVIGVRGGVVRATDTPPAKVAAVVGGGSGHYPAFCGVVGPGIADGAVVGNVFTSPSAQEAYSVGRAAASNAGVADAGAISLALCLRTVADTLAVRSTPTPTQTRK